MPSDYTVEEVTPAEQWSNDFGRFQPYDLKLAGMDSTVQLNRKLKDGQVPEAKVPKPGQKLYLTISQTEYGYRAKEEQQDGQQPISQGGSEARSNGDGPDPTQTSIERQVAAKCAAQLISPGVKVPADKRSEFAEWVHFLIDTFYDAIADSGPLELELEPTPQQAPKSDADIPF